MPPLEKANKEDADLLAAQVKRQYWEKWNEENKDAIAAYNARIAKDGLPLAKYRNFAPNLGDGKQSRSS